TDQDADAGANVRHDAQTSLKRVLEFDTVVSQGKATNQDTVTRPSHHIDGLDNKRDDLAPRMYKHSKTICYKAFYVIGLPNNQLRLGMTNVFVFLQMCGPASATPTEKVDLDQPLVYLSMMIVLFAINILFAVATAFRWIESGSGVTGGNTLALATGTIVLSILTMIVLYDTKHFPTLSFFLMIPSSFAHFTAMPSIYLLLPHGRSIIPGYGNFCLDQKRNYTRFNGCGPYCPANKCLAGLHVHIAATTYSATTVRILGH
ncbi:unnamed protein product, partial [Aureobasidium pullulans]